MEIDPRHSLFFPDKVDLKKGLREGMKKEVLVGRESAIKSGKVSIISLPGLETDLTEYFDEGRQCWTFEPVPRFEKVVRKDDGKTMKAFGIGRNGKFRLWQILENTAKDLKTITGQRFDMALLTPYEAVQLVGETIRKNMEYEDLIGESVSELMISKKIATSRPDLLPLLKTDPAKFESEAERVGRTIDGMTAETLLETGFGVCRHIAAVSTVLYELLKEKQQGTLLNGTYLVYKSERTTKEPYTSVVGNHAYNVLAVTAPTGEVKVSVLDTTWMLGKEGDGDYTWDRISQACSFISGYGEYYGIEEPDLAAMELAEKAVRRLEYFFFTKEMRSYASADKMNILDFLSDYVCLVDQTKIGKVGGTLHHSVELLGRYGLSRNKAAMEILKLPSFVNELANGVSVLRHQRTMELNLELNNIDFFGSWNTDLKDLSRFLGKTLGGYNLNRLKELEAGKVVIDDNDLDGLELIGHFVRSCIGLETAPENMEQVLVVQQALNVVRKYGIEGDLLNLGGNFLSVG